MSKISEAMQTAINSFITYGVDDNTKNWEPAKERR